ncbi:hypothetical protein [Phenylobacterium sp.]|uniref:hypothetical protein n=1 Tax=Phenylobacterium sp. TaxID=1871053 RepID=UPI002E3149EF|nr:hypothetical protein [Phenylobacterium sp.]HEX2558848.1 hypothetical protein [Phenylobacterium sp.]
MRPWAAAALAALLAACGPAAQKAQAPAPAPAPTALDCAKGFDVLASEIAAQPDFAQAPSPGEPYRFLNHRSGTPSYVVTLPDAPAHPAILMQRTVGGAMQTTGCRYGDEAAYGQLVAYIEGLRAAR